VRAMVKAQQEVVEADLPQEVRLALRLQLAVGLLQQEEHELALAEFSQLEFEPGSPRHDRWVQQYALALRRQGERALQQDGDPDDAWDRAKAILGSALQAKTSAETCGIAAGLAKRQFQRFLDRGQPVVALAHLNDAVDLYRRGFDSDPLDYYTGVNLVSLLRLRGQHFRGDDPDLRDVAELLPVVRFHAGRAARSNLDFWPAVTVAELVLDELLLSPHAQDAAPAVIAYVQALARRPSPDSWRSSRSQLEMFLKAGDPGDLIKPVCAVFDAST
jgi:tetratricopeptide (TPR) repeat protein